MGFEAYAMHLAVLTGIAVIGALALNLAVGFAGLLNLAIVAISILAAYVSALLSIKFGLPFWATLFIACAVAGVVGLLLSIPTMRLKGDYFMLATVGFSIVIENVLLNWNDVTRGPLGLPGIPRPELFGLRFASVESYLLLTAFFVIVAFFAVRQLVRSPFGRVLKAIRDDELAVASLGKDVVRFKTIALVISSVLAGLGGVLYAHYIQFIHPSDAGIFFIVFYIAMIVVGGLASVEGSVLGAVIITLLPEPLRFLGFPPELVGALRQAVFSAVLLLLLLKRPEGLLGEHGLTGVAR
jgi:branched-chain amino acid transport system permease protein